MLAWGRSDRGELGLGPPAMLAERDMREKRAFFEPVSVDDVAHLSLAQVAAGDGHSLLLTTEGDVYACGSGQTGCLGLGYGQLRADRFTQVTLGGVAEARIVSIAAGDGASAAIAADGELFEWGFVHASRQGRGPSNLLPGLANDNREAPMSDKLKALLRASTITYLTAGGNADAQGRPQLDQEAIDREAGILQMSTRRVVSYVPVATRLSVPVIKVALGYGHTLALLADGSLRAKGYNDRGQLGSGTRINSFQFEQVQGVDEPIVDIACGNSHNLACTSQGRCLAWGSNVLGQLGIGSYLGDQLVPHPVHVGLPVISVCAGSYHSLVLTSTGDAYSFGHSEYGQHGSLQEEGNDFRNLSRHFFTPQKVGIGAKLTMVKCGDHFSVGVDTEHGVWTWGWGAFGVLGRGERNLHTHATLVPGLMGVRPTGLAAGRAHVLLMIAPMGDPFALSFAGLLSRPQGRTVTLCTADGKGVVPIDRVLALARCPALLNRLDSQDRAFFNAEVRVIQALAQFIVLDMMNKCPPHRLVDLGVMATDLGLGRLAAICTLLRCQRKRRDGLMLLPGEDKVDFDSIPPSSFAQDMRALLHSGSGDVRLRSKGLVRFDAENSAKHIVPKGHSNFSWGVFEALSTGSPLPAGHTNYSWLSAPDDVCVHAQILNRYEYFAVLMSGRFAEAERVRQGQAVVLNIPHAETLEAVAEFMYTGTYASLPGPLLPELYEASRQYGLVNLSSKIESELHRGLDDDNAEAMARVAEAMGLPRLAAEARNKLAQALESLAEEGIGLEGRTE